MHPTSLRQKLPGSVLLRRATVIDVREDQAEGIRDSSHLKRGRGRGSSVLGHGVRRKSDKGQMREMLEITKELCRCKLLQCR